MSASHQNANCSLLLSYSKPDKATIDCPSILHNISQCPLLSVLPTNSGFKVRLDPSSYKTFCSKPIRSKLSDAGFTINWTPEHRARSTVVAKHVELAILTAYQQDRTDLIQDIANNNDVTVEDIYRPPNSNTLKIRCSTPEEASHLLQHGIRAMMYLIPITALFTPNYIPIIQCLKCYEYGHDKNNCSKKQICSKCSSPDHYWINCSNPLKCPNCQQPHPATSFQCQKRKDYTLSIRADNAANTPNPFSTQPQPTLSSDNFPSLPQATPHPPPTPQVPPPVHLSHLC